VGIPPAGGVGLPVLVYDVSITPVGVVALSAVGVPAVSGGATPGVAAAPHWVFMTTKPGTVRRTR
jgi:hypothetical protein